MKGDLVDHIQFPSFTYYSTEWGFGQKHHLPLRRNPSGKGFAGVSG